MAIIKCVKTDNYTIMHNECLRRDDLSNKAKGLYAYLMSLPDDWEVSMTDLQKRSTDGREAVRSGMAELGRAGYIEKHRRQGKDGKMEGWDYTVYESLSLKPNAENPSTGNPTSENPQLLSTNTELSTNNTKGGVVSQKKKKTKHQKPPTTEQIKAYALEYAKDHGLLYSAVEDKAMEGKAFYERSMRVAKKEFWVDGQGKEIKNWKLKLANVWFSKLEKNADNKGPDLRGYQ